MENKISKKILVVDDEFFNRELLCAMVAEMGCDVDGTDSGVEACEMVREKKYDMVLMDCRMPDPDGFQTTIRIRSQESGERTPIIGLTASPLEEDRLKGEQAGMDDFILKPFTSDLFEAALKRFCP
jgi:CheY-like chemotaxis protein